VISDSPVLAVLCGDKQPPDMDGIEKRALVRYTDGPNLADALHGADALFVYDFLSTAVPAAWRAADRLRWLHIASAGVDPVLFPGLRDSDVVLTNSRGVFDDSIAEYVLGVILTFAKDFARSLDLQRETRWQHRESERISGREVVIVGTGPIGRAIARLLRAAGMRVTARIELGDAVPTAAVGRTAYRIAQEGLTNARKHAPGAIVDVTVTGTLRITQAVARGMAKRGAGAIVNLMGDSGRVGESGLLVTGTTRASTVGLTRSLAKELARHGIRANCVSLALVQTDSLEAHAGGADDERMKKILAQYPLRRVGRPDDVTPMILLLASPLSGWTTGQVVSVNGGYAMV